MFVDGRGVNRCFRRDRNATCKLVQCPTADGGAEVIKSGIDQEANRDAQSHNCDSHPLSRWLSRVGCVKGHIISPRRAMDFRRQKGRALIKVSEEGDQVCDLEADENSCFVGDYCCTPTILFSTDETRLEA